MGFPLRPTLTKECFCHFEEQWMFDWPIDYEPVSYKKYIDILMIRFYHFSLNYKQQGFQGACIPNIELFILQSRNIILFPLCCIVVE